MRVLIVKTSSLGDLVHTFPAITDAVAAVPDMVCDWVVEEAFIDVPTWHPAVHTVISVAARRWRRTWLSKPIRDEIVLCIQSLRAQSYDLIIDAQGLFKSAVLTSFANGSSAGFDPRSAREPWASWWYQQRIFVPRGLHAVARVRQLFSTAIGYPTPTGPPNYGLCLPTAQPQGSPYLLFIPATTWPSKHWPVTYWASLLKLAAAHNYRVLIPWHSLQDRQQAEAILSQAPSGELLPRQELTTLASWLAGATAVVGVDTGLIHLTAALGVPVISLYGPTSSRLTGTIGTHQCILAADFPCAPCQRKVCSYAPTSPIQPACFNNITPPLVWDALQQLLDSSPNSASSLN